MCQTCCCVRRKHYSYNRGGTSPNGEADISISDYNKPVKILGWAD